MYILLYGQILKLIYCIIFMQSFNILCLMLIYVSYTVVNKYSFHDISYTSCKLPEDAY